MKRRCCFNIQVQIRQKNIKMGLKITMWDFRGWIHLAEARDKTQILMKTLINPRLPNTFGNFLTKWVKFRASTNNMLYKVNYQYRIAFQIVNPAVVTFEIPHPHSCRSPQSVLYIYIYIYIFVCVLLHPADAFRQE